MTNDVVLDPYLPIQAEILAMEHQTPSIFTLQLRFVEKHLHYLYSFHPGQFNMIYLYGVGEVAISIVSDPDEKYVLSHSIRAVGHVTKALQKLKVGDHVGVRGPFGHGWPLHKQKGKDIVVVMGGLGAAPSVSIINYIMLRRTLYGKLKILQGVKHSDDFIFQKKCAEWQKDSNTEIHITADQPGKKWPWNVGYVTDMLKLISLQPENTVALMCGPEMMMHVAIKTLVEKGVDESNIYLSMERNMECGIGHCGHCQYGGYFVCKDGPVFSYPEIKPLFKVAGF